MKPSKKALTFFFILALPLALFAAAPDATPTTAKKADDSWNLKIQFPNIKAGESVNLAQNETIEKDFIAAGQTITIDGTVKGDVYAAGQTIIVNGTVMGDLIAAGQTIIVKGKVGEDARLAASEIQITGEIVRDAALAAATITQTGSIGGDAFVAGSSFTQNGPIKGNAVITGDKVALSNTIEGKTDVRAAQITIASSAVFKDTLYYSTQQTPTIATGASIASQEQIPWPEKNSKETEDVRQVAEKAKGGIFTFLLVLRILGFLGSLLVGVVLIALFKKQILAAVPKTVGEGFIDLGIGAVVFAAPPILFLILLFTVIGIPLLIIAGLLWLLLVILAGTAASIILGTKIVQAVFKKDNLYFGLLTGAVILLILKSIPVIGGFCSLAVLFYGIGAIIKIDYRIFKRINE
ncbi:MAG: polymer-forming cytoskeletal protein [bacterium]